MAEATNGREAIEAVDAHRADVVLIDIAMPELNGTRRSRRSRHCRNSPRRERELLSLVADGATNSEVAARLFLSEKTVRNNVSMIFTKLHVADRANAVIQARIAGLGAREPR